MVSKANKKKSVFEISNKTYDTLKVLVTIVLPAISALLVALSQIWGLGFEMRIEASITAIVAFLNVLLGLFIAKSSSEYKKANTKQKAQK